MPLRACSTRFIWIAVYCAQPEAMQIIRMQKNFMENSPVTRASGPREVLGTDERSVSRVRVLRKHRRELRHRLGVLADDIEQLIELHAIAHDPRVRFVDLLLAHAAGAPLPEPHRSHPAGHGEIGELVD